MYSYLFFILSIEYLSFSIIFCKSFITIPFSYKNKQAGKEYYNSSTHREYFESLISYPVYSKININNKSINFHITLDRYASYISEKTFKEIIKEQENLNDENEEKLYSLDYIGINRVKLKKSNFTFLLDDNKNIIFENYSFFVATKINNFSDYEIKKSGLITESDEIGFKVVKGNKYDTIYINDYGPYFNAKLNNKVSNNVLSDSYVFQNDGYYIEEKTNLIEQLKAKDYISSYTFSIKYDDKNEEKGKIIIGGYPHEFDKKHYQSKFFIYDVIPIKFQNYLWHYDFIDITYNGEKLPWGKNVEFSLNFGFILSTYNYKDYLDEVFFENSTFSEFCKEETVGEYFVKYCHERVIKYFNKLRFYLSNTYIESNQTNYIEFNYSDLFVKAPGNNDLYYFQIIFVDNSYKWIFGRPLFKKYRTVFDQDAKIIGFYTEEGEYKDDIKNNDEKNNSSIVLILICILFILFCCIILLGILFYKYKNKNRKKKANELEDNYDYSPSIEERGGLPENPLLINE